MHTLRLDDSDNGETVAIRHLEVRAVLNEQTQQITKTLTQVNTTRQVGLSHNRTFWAAMCAGVFLAAFSAPTELPSSRSTRELNERNKPRLKNTKKKKTNTE